MLVIPGQPGKDLCDRGVGITRRELLRVGGAGMLGMSLGAMFRLQARAGESTLSGGPGWGKAKSIILCYLQGGPSHLDLWDPKENVPDNVRSAFKPIPTKLPGVSFTEILPKLAQVNDKFTMIRSMSYTPNGLFNHTAAIYQMMTGYTTDKVSPSGQLEPPSPKDFPNFGSNIIRMRPTNVPMLPFVMLPRPLQESNVVGKGGTAGFLGKAFDPYTLYPAGDDMDMKKMDRIQIDDLQLRPEVFADRLKRRARLRELINDGMPTIDKAVAYYKLDEYYDQALNLIVSGRAREAFALEPRTGRSCAIATAATRSARAVCSPGGWSKPARASSRSSGRRSPTPTTTPGTTTSDLTKRMKNQSGPMLDTGLVGTDRGPGRARPARRDAGRRRRRVRPQPAEGRQHLRQRQQRRRPRPLAVLLHGRDRRSGYAARPRARQERQDRVSSG